MRKGECEESGSVSIARGAKSREGERPGGLGTHRRSVGGRAWHGGVRRLTPVHGALQQGAFEGGKDNSHCNNGSLMGMLTRVVCRYSCGKLRACRFSFPLWILRGNISLEWSVVQDETGGGLIIWESKQVEKHVGHWGPFECTCMVAVYGDGDLPEA